MDSWQFGRVYKPSFRRAKNWECLGYDKNKKKKDNNGIVYNISQNIILQISRRCTSRYLLVQVRVFGLLYKNSF